MALVRTTLVGIDKEGARVFRLPTGHYLGGDFETGADVDAHVKKYPQQQGMDPALYRRQYGPITPETS